MKKILTSLIMAALVFLAVPASGQELSVVTTFSILEDLVGQVGGERVEVRSLIPLGADPHTWEPTPREARAATEADLFIANGGGFDDWLFRLVENAARQDAPLVVVSEGLTIIEHDQGHDHDHDHHGDPHFWLSVPNASYYVEQITQALISLSPGDASYFQARSDAYVQELRELDQWMVDELAKIPAENRVIVTYHNAFSYMAERYGFDVAEFLVANPDTESTPRELARLVNVLQGMSNRAAFTEPQLASGTRYMQTLVGETGGKLFTLYSDSLSAEIPTYIAMMQYNTDTLLEALK